MRPKSVKTAGIGALLSLQLFATPSAQGMPTAFLSSNFISGGSDLGSLEPLLQDLATDLLGGLSIGGVDLSNVVMDAVFGPGGVVNGGGIDLGSVIETARTVLEPQASNFPGGPQVYSILKDVLNGDFRLQSILGPLLEKILKGQGNTGGQIPGGTPPINPSGSASGGESGPSTGGTTIGNGGVRGTGSTTCLYSSTCRANSNPYQTIYSQAMGVQGFPNPNEVRGKIYQEATSERLMSDIYASNPNIGSYFAGNQSDRDINRASTEAILSKAGQEHHKRINDDSIKAVQAVGDMVKQCAKNSKSSQELIRCNLLAEGIEPSFDAAQLSMMLQEQKDNQFQKIELGNISASADAQRRQRDVENAGLSISSMKAIWTTPERW